MQIMAIFITVEKKRKICADWISIWLRSRKSKKSSDWEILEIPDPEDIKKADKLTIRHRRFSKTPRSG